MPMIKHLVSILCLASALVTSAPAYSCSVIPPELSKYISGKIPNGVIFIGNVVTIKESPAKNGESRLEVTFQVKKRYVGNVKDQTLVLGSVGSMKATSCEGVFDFRVAKGETWVIVGETKQLGTVSPNVFLSKSITLQKIPNTLEDLEKLISQ